MKATTAGSYALREDPTPRTRLVAVTAPPPVVVEPLRLRDGRIVHVVRDDLLDGGTKERGLAPLVQDLAASGVRRFVYASPFCGFAQIALASAARRVGRDAVVFAGAAPGGSGDLRGARLHGYSREAGLRGAHVVRCASLDDAEARARAFTDDNVDAHKLPLGFACDAFFSAYERALRVEWRRIETMLGRAPEQLFVPVGSGTLLRAFARVIPASVTIEAIDVNVLASDDPRIASIAGLPRVRLHRSELPFASPSRAWPPFPSNRYYDAKLLPFVERLAGASSVWWNVAR